MAPKVWEHTPPDFSQLHHRLFRWAIGTLVLSVFLGCLSFAFAGSAFQDLGLSLNHQVSVKGGNKKVTVAASNANVRELLHDMAQQGGFNLMLDDSVTGTISLELKGVTINNALSAIAALANLEIIPRTDNIYLAITQQAATQKQLNRSLTKVLKVNFSNATQIASLINSSLFAAENAQLQQSGGGGGSFGGGGGGAGGGGSNMANQFQKIKADPRTNTLIIIGNDREIELAEKAVQELDRPRDMKTFYLNYANAITVASQLAASVFNDGTANFTGASGAGGAAGGAGGSGGQQGGQQGGQNGQTALMSQPATIPVESETLQEGTGINTFGSNGGQSSSVSQQLTLRGVVKQSSTASINPMGPLVIPDTRLNAVTVMGTTEQIRLAEEMIPIFDAQAPQVVVDVSVIEVSEEGVKELSSSLGYSFGKVRYGFNTTGNLGAGYNVNGTGSQARTGIGFTTQPLTTTKDFATQISALITSERAKVLASPSITATHDTESVVSIVDEIVRRVTVTVQDSVATTQTEIGEAGIVLDILPKIGEDGTVSLRVRPSITSVSNIVEDAAGNIVTLLTRREMLSQLVRVPDGKTLVLAGLVEERQTKGTEKLPGLGDLPIVGALFRASSNTNNRTEIIISVTPHLINKITPTPAYFSSPLALQPSMLPPTELSPAAQALQSPIDAVRHGELP